MVVAVCAATVAALWVVAGELGARTTVGAELAGEVEIYDGRIGSVYNFGVPIWVDGPGPVTIRTARARTANGFRQVEPLVGYTCGGRPMIYGDVGADLRHKPDTDLRLPGEASIRASAKDPCWYLLLRFVPERTGIVTADGGEIVYRAGRLTRHLRFDFHAAVHVTGAGRDPRDRRYGEQPGSTTSPAQGLPACCAAEPPRRHQIPGSRAAAPARHSRAPAGW